MSTRLVILGFLRQRPFYGYELKSNIEEHMGDWTNIAFGSIYFALAKLSEEGYIEKVSTEQSGNRPSRSIYQITETGRHEFMRLLRQVWAEHERQFFPLDIGVFYMDALPRNEVIKYLQDRVERLEGTLLYLQEHQRHQTAREDVPRLANVIFTHTRLHLEAELSWTRELLENIQNGNYP